MRKFSSFKQTSTKKFSRSSKNSLKIQSHCTHIHNFLFFIFKFIWNSTTFPKGQMNGAKKFWGKSLNYPRYERLDLHASFIEKFLFHSSMNADKVE
jgi:hypothetical protein